MRAVVIGTAGHIDHGKSSLVRALTGTDPDRLAEEKARGITIDLGFAHLQIGDAWLSFVDVPGHERFIKNMLAGVGGVDAVMLVVAADESVMPQTREHFDICRLLRVPVGLVALTKMDLADEDSVQIATADVEELVVGSFLDGAPIVAVSARTGEGLDELRRALADVAAQSVSRSWEGASRLPIDRVFTMKGFGTVVTGTLVSGRIVLGESLEVLPGGRRVTVRGLQVHGVAREDAVAGERAALNLAGVEVNDLCRGDVLTSGGDLIATQVVDVTVELLPGARPIRYGTRVRFHQGTCEAIGRVAVAGGEAVLEGSAYARIRLERPMALRRGDRFILRTYSPLTTIGGGTVLDPCPHRASVRSPAAIARFQRLDLRSTDELEAAASAATLMIEQAAANGLPLAALVSRVGLSPVKAEALEARLLGAGAAVRVGELLVLPGVLEGLKRSMIERLEVHHRSDRLSEGVPREEVRQQLFGRGHPALFERAVADLVRAGRIIAKERLTLAAHRVELSAEEERVSSVVEETLRAAELTPPDLVSLTASAQAGRDVVDRVLHYLQRQGRVVTVGGLLFHQQTLSDLKGRVRALKDEKHAAGGIDVAAFKEQFGVTRKFAIPLLEYLDRERVTRRAGDRRVVL